MFPQAYTYLKKLQEKNVNVYSYIPKPVVQEIMDENGVKPQ